MTKEEKEQRANMVILTMGDVDLTRRDIALVMEVRKRGNTCEVFTLDHPIIKQIINKGLVKPCKLRCGPLAIPVDEPGITLTEFGRKVAEHVERYIPEHQDIK